MERKVLLEVKNISKSFGITKALKNVSFQVYEGEVRGLIGENGSGKSTVSSIISGIQKADEGSIFYQGKEFKPENILDANKHNICMIVQEQSTVTTISVAANIFIGKEDMFSKGGVVDRRKMEAEAQKALDEVGIRHIRPKELTSLEKPLISEKYTRLNIKERCSSTRHILSAELFSIKMEGQMFWKR